MALSVAYLNFWTDPHNDRWFSRFIEHHFGAVHHVRPDENPDILFTSVFGALETARATEAKCKIFFYGESLSRWPDYNDQGVLEEVFDLIVGFRPTNLARKAVRFPLWLLYYPFYAWRDEDNILSYIKERRKLNQQKPKEFLGSCVATHDMGGQRTTLYNECVRYGEIKCPSGFNTNAPSIGPAVEDKIEFISKGFYSICAENSSFDQYCTEKIFHALEAGTIPIYWSKDIPEPDVLHAGCYSYVNVYEPSDVARQISLCMQRKQAHLQAPIFTARAPFVIDNYYRSLASAISRHLELSEKGSIRGVSYAARRFASREEEVTREARQSAYFQSFVCHTEDSVEPTFKERHRGVWQGAPGAGYWIWKPHILLKELRALRDNDVLVYFDSGCSLCVTDAARQRFGEYVEMVRDHWTGFLRFELSHLEKDFTNSRTFDFFGKKFGADMTALGDTKQLVGGILVLRKTAFVEEFFSTLLSILEEDELLLSDAYTRPGEQHRHDQSLSSMLYKVLGGSLIVSDETFFEEGFSSERSQRFPIWATRSNR